MLLSEQITKLIEDMLNEQNGIAELKRNELATQLGCVPSQISYVITSRFNKDRGYIVESRRGGGGYIRIIKPQMTASTYLCHLLGSVGNGIDPDSASYLVKDLYAKELVSEREAILMIAALTNKSVYEMMSNEEAEYARAEMFKSLILSLMRKI